MMGTAFWVILILVFCPLMFLLSYGSARFWRDQHWKMNRKWNEEQDRKERETEDR